MGGWHLGLGYAIATRFAKDGLNVAVNDIASKREKLDKVMNEIREIGRESMAVTADVTSEVDVKEMVDSVASKMGGLDVARLSFTRPAKLWANVHIDGS